MATVEKDFKVKKGLVVEGTTGTINNYDILTKKTDDQNYIIGLIGGSSDSANTPNTVVKRDGSGDFAAGTITANLIGDVTGNADTATALETSRTISLTGDATGSASFDGTANAQITVTLDSSFATDSEVSSAVAQGVSDAADYTDGEIITALSTAQGYANTAESNANSYTSTALLDYTTTANLDSTVDGYGYLKSADLNGYATETYADNAASNAQSAAELTASNALSSHESDTSTHGVTGNIVGTTDTQTLSNKTLGSDLAAGGYKVSGLSDPSANQDAATKAYVDGAVADLVNGAPALLDTLNELAAAIGDDAGFVTTVTTSIGEKVAKAGDSMSGNLDFGGTNKVTSLATPTSNGDAANKLYVDDEVSGAVSSANSYTDGRETAITSAYQSYADQAELDAISSANSYTDGEITTALSTAQGYANTAQSNAESFATTAANNAQSAAEATASADATTKANNAQSNAETFATNAINALDTDAVEEGINNLYFSDFRAKSAMINPLTDGTQTNISVSYDSVNEVYNFVAENGVADSTTSDLAEGSNLYFTDARAVSALEAVTPNFPAIEIDSVAKQVAASALVATASTNTAASWLKADYRSAEFLVKIANGTHTEISKVMLTLDTSDNIAITEYAMVGTNGSLGSVSADISTNDVRLRVTTNNNNSTVTVMGTLLV